MQIVLTTYKPLSQDIQRRVLINIHILDSTAFKVVLWKNDGILPVYVPLWTNHRHKQSTASTMLSLFRH